MKKPGHLIAEFEVRATMAPEHCLGSDSTEDYLYGYEWGLRQDNAAANNHIVMLACSGDWLTSNMPNNVLYGYIHGKHERVHGEPCVAAIAMAEKLGDSFRLSVEPSCV